MVAALERNIGLAIAKMLPGMDAARSAVGELEYLCGYALLRHTKAESVRFPWLDFMLHQKL